MTAFLINDRGNVCRTMEFDVTNDFSSETILKNKKRIVSDHHLELERIEELKETVSNLEEVAKGLEEQYGEVTDVPLEMPEVGKTDPSKAVSYG